MIDERGTDAATRRTILVASGLLMAVAAVHGALFALVVAGGLPYDEPAHWANVLYFHEQGRLPVLGENGVTYEGQQTPLYYLLAAGIIGVAGEQLLAVRAFGVVGFVLLTGLTAFIAASVTRRRVLVTIATTAFVALNPMLAVMSGSVQNDTWALVWGLLAIALAVRPLSGPRWLQGAVVGLAASLAILTKVSMAPLLLGVLIAYVLRRRFVEPAVAAGAAALVTGWWFIRNVVLYGDLTGQSAVALTGAEFESAPAGPVALAQRVLTYLTLPTEYLRNAIEAPGWVDAMALVIGVVMLGGLVLLAIREWRRCSRWGLAVVCLVAAASVAAWLVQSLFGWPVAFRTAYGALPLFALGAGIATQAGRARWAQVGVIVVMTAAQLVTGAWVLAALLGIDPSPML